MALLGFPGHCVFDEPQFTEGEARPTESEPRRDGFGATIAIDTLTQSFLPPGMSFAIVDRKGQVQFHSLSERNLSENVLDEVPERGRLETLLESRTTETISVTYHGVRHRLHHAWLSELDGHLLILHDTSVTGTLNLEAILKAFIAMFGYLVLLATLLIMAVLAYGADNATWYWPNRALSHRYYVWIELLVPGTGWFATTVWMVRGDVAAVIIVMQSMLVLALMLLRFESGVGIAYDRVRGYARVVVWITGPVLILANVGLLIGFLLNEQGAGSSDSAKGWGLAVAGSGLMALTLAGASLRDPRSRDPGRMLWPLGIAIWLLFVLFTNDGIGLPIGATLLSGLPVAAFLILGRRAETGKTWVVSIAWTAVLLPLLVHVMFLAAASDFLSEGERDGMVDALQSVPQIAVGPDVLAAVNFVLFMTTLILASVFVPKEFKSDGWVSSLLPAAWWERAHPIYRQRFGFFMITGLVIVNVAVLPAVGVYSDARSEGLSRLQMLEQKEVDEWLQSRRTGKESVYKWLSDIKRVDPERRGALAQLTQPGGTSGTVEEPDVPRLLQHFKVAAELWHVRVDTADRANGADESVGPASAAKAQYRQLADSLSHGVRTLEESTIGAARFFGDCRFGNLSALERLPASFARHVPMTMKSSLVQALRDAAAEPRSARPVAWCETMRQMSGTRQPASGPHPPLADTMFDWTQESSDGPIRVFLRSAGDRSLYGFFYALALVATLVFILIQRWFGRHVFGLYMQRQPPVSTWRWEDMRDTSCLWVGFDDQDEAILEGIPPGNRFDLLAYVNPSRVPVLIPEDPTKPIFLRHLESCLVYPAVAGRVLGALERQLYSDHRLIITSEMEPMAFIQEQPTLSSERWGLLFANLHLVQSDVRRNVKAFD